MPIDNLHNCRVEKKVNIASFILTRWSIILVDRLDINVHKEAILIDIGRISQRCTGLLGYNKPQIVQV